jgi:hypothetical protein
MANSRALRVELATARHAGQTSLMVVRMTFLNGDTHAVLFDLHDPVIHACLQRWLEVGALPLVLHGQGRMVTQVASLKGPSRDMVREALQETHRVQSSGRTEERAVQSTMLVLQYAQRLSLAAGAIPFTAHFVTDMAAADHTRRCVDLYLEQLGSGT